MATTPFALLLFAWPTPNELRALPDVAAVDVRAADSPTHRVIHILDWHYVPAKRFKIDTPDGDYDAFLADVESLQDQQRATIKAIDCKSVFLEGLTATNLPHYSERIERLKKMPPAKGDDDLAIFFRMIRREDTLQLGAPGAMLIAGELAAVLPAEDPELHSAADPIKDGKLEFDAAANKAREDAIAKLVTSQAASVIVLGGEHDLTDNLAASVEYVRVTLKAYRKASGQD